MHCSISFIEVFCGLQSLNCFYVFSVDCIWTYNGCIKWKRKAESECKLDFNDCSMVAMGMAPTERPVTTTEK